MGELRFTMVDVVSLLGLSQPNSKRSFYVQCPCCDPLRKKHLHINLVKQCYYCVICGQNGGMISLYALFSGLSPKDAYEAIMQRLGLTDDDRARAYAQVRPRPVPTAPPQKPIADVRTRDAVYRAMLNKLNLSDAHRQNLLARGLNDMAIMENMYRSMPLKGRDGIAQSLCSDGYPLEGVPGFYKENGVWKLASWYNGIAIPAIDYDGYVRGISIRKDTDEKRKYRWLSSSEQSDGCAAEAYPHLKGALSETIYLTEGQLKSDVYHHLSGNTILGSAGVSASPHLEFCLKELHKRGVKQILCAYDMDYKTNWRVRHSYDKVLALISQIGFGFQILNWENYKGIDDMQLAYMKDLKERDGCAPS